MAISTKNTLNLSRALDPTKALDLKILDEVLVIIPCYNEQDNIEKSVHNLVQDYHYNFIVIDDCSSDNSLAIIKKHQWNYIHNDVNLGLSKSFRKGVQYALEHGYKYVIQYDGDGQHNAKDIINMIVFAQKGYDLVLTSRYYSMHNLTRKKVLAHKLLRFVVWLRTHEKITDPTCGLRLFNWIAMQYYVNNPKLEVEPSTIAYLLARKKLKMKEVQTTVFRREAGNSLFASKRKIIKYMLKQLFYVIFLESLYSSTENKEPSSNV